MQSIKTYIEKFEENFSQLGKASLMIYALEFKIFDFLIEPRTVSEISSHFIWHEGMTALFCEALVEMKYLDTQKDTVTSIIYYKNSKESNYYLVTTSPQSQYLNFSNKIRRINPWFRFETLLKAGPSIIPDDMLMSKDWIRGIAQSSQDGQIDEIIEIIEKHIDLTKTEKLLDLGGGHGLYAIRFSQKYPNIKSIVYDKPEIIEVAKEYIKESGLIIETIGSDYISSDIPINNDIIFSSFTRASSDPRLISKLSNALQKNGYLITRRHAKRLESDALKTLEWNFVKPESRKEITSRYSLDIYPKTTEYAESLKEQNFKIIYCEAFDEISDLIIAKKNE